MTDVVNRFTENQTKLEFNVPPTFSTIEAERQHRKERLAGALRVFGKLGFSEGVAGTSRPGTPNCWTTSGSTPSA